MDGFNGEIKISGDIVRKHPKIQERIEAGKNVGEIIIRNPVRENTPPKIYDIWAEAVINGKTVRHKVIAADIYNQAFAYDHLLDIDEFCVATRVTKPPKRRPPNKKPKAKNAVVKKVPAKQTVKPAVKQAVKPAATPAAAAKK